MLTKVLIVLVIWLAAGVIILPFVIHSLKKDSDRLGPPPIK